MADRGYLMLRRVMPRYRRQARTNRVLQHMDLPQVSIFTMDCQPSSSTLVKIPSQALMSMPEFKSQQAYEGG